MDSLMELPSYVSFALFGSCMSIGLYDFFNEKSFSRNRLFVLVALFILISIFPINKDNEFLCKVGLFFICLFFITYYTIITKEKNLSKFSILFLVVGLFLINYSFMENYKSWYSFMLFFLSLILISLIFYNNYMNTKNNHSVAYYFNIFFIIYSSLFFF
jgi:hypothetical protein